MSPGSVIAISDTHLDGDADSLVPSIVSLADDVKGGDLLVVGGDLFDVLVGSNSDQVKENHLVLGALERCAGRGAKVVYIEGNHDFHLRGVLREIEIQGEAYACERAGKRFLFAHGDLADQSDLSYRALRVVFRSRAMGELSRVVPGAWLSAFGSSLSGASRMKGQAFGYRRQRARDLCRAFAAARFAEGFDFVVMGHYHDDDEHRGPAGQQYINMGFPRASGKYLRWEPGWDAFRRVELPRVASA